MNAIHFLLSPLAVLLVVLARCDDGNEVPGRHRTPEPMAVRIDPTAHIWSDGYYAFVVSRTNGGALRFRGISCRKREADVSFQLVPDGRDGADYHIEGHGRAFKNARSGDPVRLEGFDGTAYLVARDERGRACAALEIIAPRPTSAGEGYRPYDELIRTVERHMAYYYLSGEYRTDEGRTIRFAPDRQAVSGLTAGGGEVAYTFAREGGNPVNVILLPDGSAYHVFKGSVSRGLNKCDALIIRRATRRGDRWVDGDTVACLCTIRRYFETESVPGEYPFPSMRILTYGIMQQFSFEEARLLSFELTARYGARFSYPVREIERQRWYQRMKKRDVKQDDLSPLERINYDLLRWDQEHGSKRPYPWESSEGNGGWRESDIQELR